MGWEGWTREGECQGRKEENEKRGQIIAKRTGGQENM
jgi:hypothetical protein